MTALFRTRRGLVAFVLVFAMLTSLGGGLPAAAAPNEAPSRAPQSNDLRISQLYGGGGNTGATYTHDFIEIFNAGASTISLAGYSVQYSSATGTGAWQVTNLSGSIASGQYYLIQQAQGAGGSTPLPTPDAIGAIAMAGGGGKAALVSSTTALAGACPTGAQIIDLVGFASNANCFEGSGPAAAPSNTTATLRAGGGCTDTDNNAADFSTGAPTPRNTASPLNVCGGGDVPPTVTSTTPTDGATSVAVNAPVSVTFSEPVTVTGTIAIDCATSGVQNATPTGGPTTFALPHTDFDPGESCTVTILASQVADQDGTPNNMAADYDWSFATAGGCFAGGTTPIHTIQGSGATSPLINTQVTVEALVVADFQGVGNINGYFVQMADSDQDADPATSEGLFIFDPGNLTPVAVGNFVRVSGTVTEFQSQTQLGTLTEAAVCAGGPTTATPANVVLPFSDLAYPERFEGMSVAMTQTLTVNETFNLGRGGILTLAAGRLQQPTNVVLPGAAANALQAANNLNWITLDDGSLLQNSDPIIYPTPLGLSALNTVRSGDSVSQLAGVLTQGNPGWSTPGILYRIHPLSAPTFTATNPRPAAPNPVRAGGSLRVSSFNVLNYFLTLDDGVNDICGPDQNMECRGADSALEFTRQRDKLLQALYILNADVVGLMELENTPNVEPLADIVAGLNGLAGAGTYDYIDAGLINPGDVIKVGIIYKPGVVQPVGDFAILNNLVDPNFDTNLHRPALAQTFQESASNGGRFTVIVNHLKSKGCTGATGLDADQGDGQSCWNLARTTASNALVNWALSDPTGAGDPDFMILGDLNSYAKEDPMVALETAGYTNLETLFVGANAYSYVFGSQAGSLDHSMANASLTPQVSGATTWHINADEPGVLDYNTEFKSPGQIISLFNADQFRTSDHDPLLIGLNLTPAAASIVVTKTVGIDPSVCATTDNITVPAGTDVTYCYEVANTGTLTLNFHDLDDSELGSLLSGSSYALAPGTSSFITETATINVTTVNTATWTAYNIGPIDVVTATDTATVTVPGPSNLVCNAAPILIPGTGTAAGPAAPYPSNILVSGLNNSVTNVRVYLYDMNHTWPDDIDILLAGPQGQNLIIMSDAGGSFDLVNVNLVFDDAASGSLPDDSQIVSGVYLPTNWGAGDTFPAPAPPPSGATQLATFNGTDPNGTWSLFVYDDANGDIGNINGGWCVEIDAEVAQDPPNIDVDPLSLSATQAPDTTTQQTLDVGNTGGADLNWEIEEEPASVLVQANAASPAVRASVAGDTGSRGAASGGSAPLAYTSPADFSEGFDDITNLPGWFMQNNSAPLGSTSWFQGNPTVFPAHAGATNAYIGANFNNTSGAGTISNWLLTPQLNLADGDTFSFWTRTADGSIWADRLQVRLSLAGASTNVGTSATDVGDFTTVLLDINPTLVSTGYPQAWTQYTATLSGIPLNATGRIAFRYFVTDAGPSGNNSNYIGIDTVEYVSAGEPGVCDAPADVPWLSLSPDNGTTAGGGTTPVTATFDSTGLTAGVYNANLCIGSNDPDPGPGNETELVIVPVELVVEDAGGDPNIFVDPLAVSSSQQTNVQTQHTVTISNTGSALLEWEIFEEPAAVVGPASPLPLIPFDAVLADEMAGIERGAPTAIEASSPAARALAKRALLTTGLLLVPDSTNDRVIALDPITGNVIDPNFVPNTPVVGTGINAILSAGGDSILLSDQTGDVVHEFDLDGNYLGVFAPAGGVNNAILDNIRGIALRPNGNLLVTVGGGGNNNAIAEFDTSGNYLGQFIAAGSGGLLSPFDIYGRTVDWLSGGSSSSAVHRFDLNGAFLDIFAPVSTFPEQINEAGNNNVLVANFSPSTNEGVHEFTPAGVFVGRYDPTGLGGYRGVYELPGGTILTTTGTGVYEINRSGQLVESKITGVGGRFIEYVAPQDACSSLADVPWLSVSPSNGTTAAGNAIDVTVTLDSTGLAVGTYNANLCIDSNDPDAGPGNETELVIVPVELIVGDPTAVTLDSLSAVPAAGAAGLSLLALPALVSLALGAAWALRRQR
jgi:predicted extracellular nuclease/subtilisin-like proprotein convertase family protein